ncbi:hypothetical protein LCGC14_0175990 [marine sediment metagenome]|uniref:Uncharacterized protein n=1 Tax=marine sediment metagenome TaxID=412755 RepID=A0A0F9URG6_9ZZZZ
MQIRRIGITFLLVLLMTLVGTNSIGLVSGASRQSDTATTPNGTEYFLTVTGRNTTFANNSMNSFMVSVDVISFGENVSSWYDVRLGFRLRNEALGWSYYMASDNTAIVNRNQPWFDFVFEVYVNATFPSQFNISLGVRFTENLPANDYKTSNWWSNILTIDVSNVANPLTPPTSRTPPTVTVNETIFAPHFKISPEDKLSDINTLYNVSWQLFASHPYKYRVNVTNNILGRLTIDTGSWVDGQIFTYFAPIQAQGNGTYYYTLEANDDYGNYFQDTIRVAVLNVTRYNELYPDLINDLGADLGGVDQFQAPFPFIPTIIGIFLLGITYRKKTTISSL